MDEVVFRASETLDSLQHQLRVAAGEGKAALLQTSGKLSDSVVRFLDTTRYADFKESAVRYFTLLLLYANEFQEYVIQTFRPSLLYQKIGYLFSHKVSKRDVIIGGTGLIVGIFVGYYTHKLLPQKEADFRYMQAIQCLRYTGIEAVSVVDEAKGPRKCNQNEVLISVKACSVNIIDRAICDGYGSKIRALLASKFEYSQAMLPVTLGRDCTGVVIDIGQNVTRFEVGDTVWACTPFWAPGTMSELAAIPEWMVGKMPEAGFESATSIPFAGGTALATLDLLQLNILNAEEKSIFIHGGCSAIGCLLVQILKYWGAKVTVSCYQKALPVARALHVNDIVTLASYHGNDSKTMESNAHLLKKELKLHEKFFAIILTMPCEVEINDLKNYCADSKNVVTTLPPPMKSDRYGIFRGLVYAMYVRFKSAFQTYRRDGLKGYGEDHICFEDLDRLAQYVDNGVIQTVVDRVFQPHEIDEAMNHIQSLEAIGSTVITFR